MSRLEVVRFAGHGGDEIHGIARRADGEGHLPALVLVQEAFGIDAHIASMVERFAGDGFTVIAPDLFAREGQEQRREPRVAPDGTPSGFGVPASRKGKEDSNEPWNVDEIRGAVASLPDRRVLGDLEGALAHLSRDSRVDASALGAVGFCMGGNYALLLGCTSRRLSAVVDFYGRFVYRELSAQKPTQPLDMLLNLSVPLLAMFGEDDPSIAREDVARLRETLDRFAKEHTLVTFPGVGHGFMNDRRKSYDRAAAEKAWKLAVDFLREHVVPSRAP
jgi:carboxymethylenebutenolidase